MSVQTFLEPTFGKQAAPGILSIRAEQAEEWEDDEWEDDEDDDEWDDGWDDVEEDDDDLDELEEW